MAVHLKEIRLENFKSFAGKVRIPLNEGYTCITGPNGSGKSNISDAILFVLGPKSSKAIRAGKLTELLFNGGKTRSPARKCQVSLIFDNRDGTLPLAEREVTFTRLIKLSSGNQNGYNSYFYVNGKQTTLMRFEELLAHAGIASDGYNLVQQGDINRIVDMGNVERRRVLEDVAGISRFDEEIDKARKQEAQADANLERINIIIEELGHQASSLAKQREAAMKRKGLYDETKRYRAQLSFKIVEELEAEIASITEHIADYESKSEERLARRKELSGDLEDLTERINVLEKEMADRGGDEAKRLKKEMDDIKVEMARNKEAIELGRAREKEIKAEIKHLEKEAGDSSETAENARKELVALRAALVDLTERRDEAARKVKEARGSVELNDKDLGKIKKQILKVKNAMEEALARKGELVIARDALESRMETLLKEKAVLEEARNYKEFDLKDIKWQLSELKKETKASAKGAKEYREELDAQVALEKQLKQEARDLENAINTLNRKFNNLKAELDAKRMVQSGYATAVRSLLELRDKGDMQGIIGSVAELIDVDKKHEVAVEVAAGNRLQALVVDSDSTASRCINYLKKNRLGRVSFLPLDKMLPGRPRGKAIMARKESEGFAIDLVRFEEKYHGAMWYVFGDTVVVKSLAQARKLMGGVRLVTLQGELIEPAGAMIGGTLERKGLKLGKVREEDLDKVGKELRAAVAHSGEISKKLAGTRKLIEELESRYREAAGTGDGHRSRIAALESQKKEVKLWLDNIRGDIEAKEKELSSLEKEMKDTAASLEKADKEAADLQGSFVSLNKKLVDSAPAELSRAIRDAEKDLTTLEREVAKTEAAISSREDAVALYSKGNRTTEKRREELLGQIEAIRNERKKRTKAVSEGEVKLASMMKLTTGMDESAEKMRNERDTLYKKKVELEGELEALRIRSDAQRDYFVSLKTQLKAKNDALEERRRDIEGIDIGADDKIPPSDKLEKFIRINEAKLEALGPVNMHSIEEYERVSERVKDLKEQTKRLKDEKKRLRKLLDEAVDAKTRGLLNVLDAVNDNFNMTYKRLSGGGEASLELENADDPFAGGLLMKARPPGKKVYRLEALSGGEKSLAALAFIFAIQQYKPSPFYLLDEADANLDALNAESAAKMIRSNSNHAQFLQVSHRKVTLKEASNLIGVTMQEKGVSTIVMKVNIQGEGPVPDDMGPVPRTAEA